jgi:hypothetical protein
MAGVNFVPCDRFSSQSQLSGANPKWNRFTLSSVIPRSAT